MSNEGRQLVKVEQVYKVDKQWFDDIMDKMQRFEDLILHREKEEKNAKPKYLDKQEVMEVFGVTEKTLENWEKSNKLIPKRNGRIIRYVEHEVYSFLK